MNKDFVIRCRECKCQISTTELRENSGVCEKCNKEER